MFYRRLSPLPAGDVSSEPSHNNFSSFLPAGPQQTPNVPCDVVTSNRRAVNSPLNVVYMRDVNRKNFTNNN